MMGLAAAGGLGGALLPTSCSWVLRTLAIPSHLFVNSKLCITLRVAPLPVLVISFDLFSDLSIALLHTRMGGHDLSTANTIQHTQMLYLTHSSHVFSFAPISLALASSSTFQ